MIEDEMVGWHHHLNRHEFEQAPGDAERQGSLGDGEEQGSLEDGEGQGSLECHCPWGHKELDKAEQQT